MSSETQRIATRTRRARAAQDRARRLAAKGARTRRERYDRAAAKREGWA